MAVPLVPALLPRFLIKAETSKIEGHWIKPVAFLFEKNSNIELIMTATKFAIVSAICILFASSSSANELEAQQGVEFNYQGRTLKIFPAFEDYSFMLSDACDALKLNSETCAIYPMNGDLGKNALATILDGNKIIVFDRNLSPLVGYEGAMAIIAHELGHHLCGHIEQKPSVELELEADMIAGAVMNRAKFSLSAALSYAPLLGQSSISHPSKESRLRAITAGWNSPQRALKCGDE